MAVAPLLLEAPAAAQGRTVILFFPRPAAALAGVFARWLRRHEGAGSWEVWGCKREVWQTQAVLLITTRMLLLLLLLLIPLLGCYFSFRALFGF